MIETTEHAVLLEHVTKTYAGVERSVRDTMHKWTGPALWLRNLLRVARLTSNAPAPVQASLILSEKTSHRFHLPGFRCLADRGY